MDKILLGINIYLWDEMELLRKYLTVEKIEKYKKYEMSWSDKNED